MVVGKDSRELDSREGRFTQKLVEVLYETKQFELVIEHFKKNPSNSRNRFQIAISAQHCVASSAQESSNSAYLGPDVRHDACCVSETFRREALNFRQSV
jgi:hypothetical protein